MKFDAVLFDIDDTFYLRNEPFIRACKDLLADHMDLDWAELFRVRNRYSDALLESQSVTGITNEELYMLRMQLALKEYGEKISLGEVKIFEDRYSTYQGEIRLYDGYAELLDELKERNIPMGIITNGTQGRQKAKYRVLGLDKWIPETYCFVSEEVGAVKPQKEIFQKAAEAMGLATGEEAERGPSICFVGDNYPMDIEGAAGAGWKTVWFNANGDVLPEKRKYEADYIVHDALHLRDVLLAE